MPYREIALCLAGALFFYQAAKLEAQGGCSDHGVLWAALSLLSSFAVLAACAGWVLWIVAQLVLMVVIAIARVVLDPRA